MEEPMSRDISEFLSGEQCGRVLIKKEIKDSIFDEFKISLHQRGKNAWDCDHRATCLHCGAIISPLILGGAFFIDFKGDPAFEGKMDLVNHLKECEAFKNGNPKK